MDHINELIGILNSNFNWNKARVTCFAKMLLALLVTRSITSCKARELFLQNNFLFLVELKQT